MNCAERILAALPPFVTPVGLFVDAPTQTILDVSDRLRLRHVQLHGNESPQQVAELHGLTVLKAIRVDSQRFDATLSAWQRAIATFRLTHLQGLVLETANLDQAGARVSRTTGKQSAAISMPGISKVCLR